MYNRLLKGFISFAVLSIVSSWSSLSGQQSPIEPNRPAIAVDREAFELGQLSTNATATALFNLRNTGNAELEITNVGKCCGANVELSSTRIAPGQSAVLKVIYTTGGEEGLFKKDLFVYSNDPLKPVLKLTIAGNVKQYLVWKPLQLLVFLNKPNLGCPTLTLTALDGKPFAITGSICSGDCITVDYDPNRMATEFVLSPKVDRQKLLAMEIPKGTLQLRLTRPDYPVVGIPFDLIPNYAVNPGQIYLAGSEPGKPVVRKIHVLDNYHVDTNQAEADFVLESVSSQKGLCKLAGSRRIRSGYELDIEVSPPAVVEGQRSYSDELTIRIKGCEDQLVVFVRGFYDPKVFVVR